MGRKFLVASTMLATKSYPYKNNFNYAEAEELRLSFEARAEAKERCACAF